MSKKPLISIIVRTKNEEKWISSCLEAIYRQNLKDFEVILVDNKSTDRTVEKAKQYPINLVEIDKFKPGKSINDGIRASSGKYLVCISAHCIPTNELWLEKLLQNFDDDKVAGVYGRQEPMSFTSPTDKRDLLLVFGLDKKIQIKDSFFHNANSMFRRDIWERIPFDEIATNIEDRIWGREIIKANLKIVYEPEASVYHYHGIHQNQNKHRCKNVVKIIEELDSKDGVRAGGRYNLNDLNIIAIIPVKGEALNFHGKSLLSYTIEQVKKSKYIKKIIISTDNEKTANLARACGAEVPFIRGEELSKDYVDLKQVYQYTLEEIEKKDNFPDLVVTLEVTFPFRNENLIDDSIINITENGLDTVLAGRKEFSSCWKFELDDETFNRIDGDGDDFTPRKFKNPMYIGMKGLCCVTHPVFIREGKLLGDSVGIIEINDPFSSIEVRDEKTIKMAGVLLSDYLETSKK